MAAQSIQHCDTSVRTEKRLREPTIVLPVLIRPKDTETSAVVLVSVSFQSVAQIDLSS
jgi:hypothetical protein